MFMICLNYGKPFIKYSTRPKDAEEHLKNFENIDLQHEFFSNFRRNCLLKCSKYFKSTL